MHWALPLGFGTDGLKGSVEGVSGSHHDSESVSVSHAFTVYAL